jgi:hypothetical protein
MISADKISDSGFTFICDNQRPFNGMLPITQEEADLLMAELQLVLERWGFDIAMVGENVEVMRLQGRMMFNKFYKMMDEMFVNQSGEQ